MGFSGYPAVFLQCNTLCTLYSCLHLCSSNPFQLTLTSYDIWQKRLVYDTGHQYTHAWPRHNSHYAKQQTVRHFVYAVKNACFNKWPRWEREQSALTRWPLWKQRGIAALWLHELLGKRTNFTRGVRKTPRVTKPPICPASQRTRPGLQVLLNHNVCRFSKFNNYQNK